MRAFLANLLKRIFLSKETVAIFSFACAFYVVFYAWPYLNQTITRIPTVIVDQDASAASRDFAFAIDASSATETVGVVPDLGSAKAALKDGRAFVIVVIPEGFEKDLSRGTPTAVEMFSDGTYPTKGRAVYSSVLTVATQTSLTYAAKNLLARGADVRVVSRLAATGLPFVSQDLFNRIAGYGIYTVCIVSCLIIQSVMFFGIALVLGGVLEEAEASPIYSEIVRRRTRWWAMFAVFTAIVTFWALFVQGPAMWALELPSMGNVVSTVVTAVFYALAITAFATTLTLVLGSRLYAALFFIPVAAPSVFLTGLTFPMESFPFWVKAACALIPSTPGANALLLASQQGATVSEVFPYLLWLAALSLAYAAAGRVLLKRRVRAPRDPDPRCA